MNLSLRCSSLADLRLKIFTEIEADLEAQFLELLELRERVRKAEQTRARKLWATGDFEITRRPCFADDGSSPAAYLFGRG
jgi:hypothetical protein